MTQDELDQFCRGLPGCSVRYPFDSNPDLRAWCIGRKMFAWSITKRHPPVVQLKADPDLVPTLIENYPYIHPGYHMNKRHWVSVEVSLCDTGMLMNLLEDAHDLVARSLPKPKRLRLLGG